MYLFGGFGTKVNDVRFKKPMNDIVTLELKTNKWKIYNEIGNWPKPRAGHQIAV